MEHACFYDLTFTLAAQNPSRALHMDVTDLDPVITLDTALLIGIKENTFSSPHLGIPICKTDLRYLPPL